MSYLKYVVFNSEAECLLGSFNRKSENSFITEFTFMLALSSILEVLYTAIRPIYVLALCISLKVYTGSSLLVVIFICMNYSFFIIIRIIIINTNGNLC